MEYSYWMHFLFSAAGVIGAGILLGRLGGEIGDRLKLGRAWSGAVLLAFATTLPELVSTVSVAMRGEIGIALGGVLGSIIFNLFVLFLVDLSVKDPIYSRVSRTQVSIGLLGIVLLVVLAGGISANLAGVRASVAHVGITSFILLAVYLIGQYRIFNLAKQRFEEEKSGSHRTIWTNMPFVVLLAVYASIAVVIFISAYNLGIAVEGLSYQYSLSATFAGATLLGIVTSLPEMTNALVCGKHREFDLALGNIFGANAFVLVVLVIADICLTQGALLASLVRLEALSSITMISMAIIMQLAVIVAVIWESKAHIGWLSAASVVLALLYMASLFISYRFPSI